MPEYPSIVIKPHNPGSGRKRIAAYCRVSSPSEEQLHSYQVQVTAYKKQFEADEDVVFVGVYGDAGISGTRADTRTGFLKMIEDCRNGQIDCIWTKSVSRFGRNTVDTLIYTRELRGLGIDVYFEKENIHTLDQAGELLLTLMAAFAESESATMSENITWGMRKRFEKGIVDCISLNQMTGFAQKDGVVTIVEEEAEVVRRVFRDYLDGYNLHEIARNLETEGVPMKHGGKSWHAAIIRSMLHKEKFMGDCLLQKYFISDPLMHHCVKNKGERTKYYIEDCYPAIVSKEEWQVVQEMMNRANKTRRLDTEAPPFVGKMYCAACGRAFNQAVSGAMNRTRKRLFCCISRKDRTGVEVPEMPYVRARAPKRPNGTGCAPVEPGEKKKPAMRPYLCSDTSLEIDEPEKAFVRAWSTLISRRQRCLASLKTNFTSEDILIAYNAKELHRLMEEGTRLKEFDTRLFRKTVERIDVHPTGKMTFLFKAGIRVTV